MKFSEINTLLFSFVDKILRQNCIIKLDKMLKLWRINVKKYYHQQIYKNRNNKIYLYNEGIISIYYVFTWLH